MSDKNTIELLFGLHFMSHKRQEQIAFTVQKITSLFGNPYLEMPIMFASGNVNII